MKYSLRDLFSETVKILIYKYSAHMPREKNLWVFGSWYGIKYSDNSKYFFEYMNQHHPEITCVWITKSKDVLDVVRKKGYRAALSNSIEGIVFALRAKVAVTCIATDTFFNGFAFSPKIVYVQLWHGVGPKGYAAENYMKDTQKIIDSMDAYSKKIDNLIKWFAHRLLGTPYGGIDWLPYRRSKYTFAVTTSKLGQEKLMSALYMEKNTVPVLGYPRHDALINNTTESVPLLHQLQEMKKNGWNICLYAPTHRTLILSELEKLLRSLYENLRRNPPKKWFFLIKLHAGSTASAAMLKKLDKLPNAHVVTDVDINQDIYTILRSTDALISDYSSLYTDYLLLDKPIIFAPFDVDLYSEKGNGFFLEYQKIAPGPIAMNWRDVFSHLRKLKKVTATYRRKRKDCLRLFHEKTDGKSNERIYRKIRSIL